MTQSRLFGGIIVLIILALTGYVGYFKVDWKKVGNGRDMQTSSGHTRDILTYVPSDTLFFVGGLEPMPFQQAIDIFAPGNGWIQDVDWTQQFTDEEKAKLPPALLMITSLMSEYLNAMADPASAAGKLGMGDYIDSVAYTVGFIPVMRIKIADSRAFTTLVDQAEQKAGVTSNQAEGCQTGFQSLLIGSNSEYAIISLSTKVEDKKSHNIIVGTEKPAQSLAGQTVLQDIKNKYNFDPVYISYLNHREIMKGLTGSGNNEFGRMLDAAINMAAEAQAETEAKQMEQQNSGEKTPPPQQTASNENPLDAIRTEACRKELMAIIES